MYVSFTGATNTSSPSTWDAPFRVGRTVIRTGKWLSCTVRSAPIYWCPELSSLRAAGAASLLPAVRAHADCLLDIIRELYVFLYY